MQEVYKEAKEIEERSRAYADTPDSNEVRALVKEAYDMCEAIEMKKSPDHIEDRLERVLDALIRARDSGHISSGDARDLEKRCRELQKDLRKL